MKNAKKSVQRVERFDSSAALSRVSKRAKINGKKHQSGDVIAALQISLTAVFQKAPVGYIGFVQELPGANTQGKTLKETRENLQEAIFLVLEANRILAEESIQGQDVIREQLAFAA